MTLFYATYCVGLIIRSLAIDFNPLPFTAGTIVNINDSYLDVRDQPMVQTRLICINYHQPMPTPALLLQAFFVFPCHIGSN